jgi:hypothetical protein
MSLLTSNDGTSGTIFASALSFAQRDTDGCGKHCKRFSHNIPKAKRKARKPARLSFKEQVVHPAL